MADKPWKVSCGRQALEGGLWRISLAGQPLNNSWYAANGQLLGSGLWTILGRWPVDKPGKVTCGQAWEGDLWTGLGRWPVDNCGQARGGGL